MDSYIGTSGWMYKNWNKKFYPKDIPKSKWLLYLSENFRTVEVNTTFYHMAKPSTFLKWKKETADDFIFSLKLYRLFTHYRRLNINEDDVRMLSDFFKNSAKLGKKRGPVLIQLPPSLKADSQLLQDFLKKFKKSGGGKAKAAIEFRHESWFDDKIYSVLKKENISFVIGDSPKWPSRNIKTADFIYARFHGHTKLFSSNYQKRTLEKLAKGMRKLKPKSIYGYFNNDANVHAPANAKEFEEIIKS